MHNAYYSIIHARDVTFTNVCNRKPGGTLTTKVFTIITARAVQVVLSSIITRVNHMANNETHFSCKLLSACACDKFCQ
jgi:hypothetical protein